MDLLIIIVVIILIMFIVYISISNGLNRALVKIDEAESGIDVALEKRYDVLTKMMDTVKAYAKHEKETLFEVINLRKGMSISEKQVAAEKMDSNFSKINVVAESYPELKSSENFQVLQKAILDTEEHLQAARRVYNSNVSALNLKIVSFPVSLVAKSKGLNLKDFFKADDTKRNDVDIEL